MAYLFDTFTNFLSGLGMMGRDKMTGFRFVKPIWTREQLEASFQSDWIARKAISIPAQDSVREWRAWQAKANQIELIEATEKRLQVRLKLQEALIKARLYGGSCLMIGVDGDMESELDPDTVGKDGLLFIHVFAPHQLMMQDLIRDITDPYYGQPAFYTLNDNTGKWGDVNIHPSRMVRLIGLDTPNPMLNSGWGDPLLSVINDAVAACGTVMQSLATMIAEAKIDVIKIPGLTEIFSTTHGTDRLIKRFTEANVAKSVVNAIVLDGEEDWQRIQVQFRGMPEIMQMYLNIAAGAADIPVTRFLGMSPGGLNATGESDLQNYYNRIGAEQELRLTPALETLDKVIIRSSLGSIDPNIFYEWNSLWEMSDSEKAAIALQKAQATTADVNSGLVPFAALSKGKCNQLIEDGTYPGLDAGIAEAEAAGEMPTEDPYRQPPPDPGGGNPPPDGGGGPPDDNTGDAFLDSLDEFLDAWSEGDHPRGQPTNAGQFGPGGGSAKSAKSSSSRSSRSKARVVRAAARAYTKARNSNASHREAVAAAKAAVQGHKAATAATAVVQQHGREALGYSTAPLGKGYSKDAKLKDGVIHTSNVYDAVLALSQDRAVNLKQPRQVSTLIDALGEVTTKMVEAGEKAPNFDLCKVTVSGTNLFCADTKGIPRVKMPQMDDHQTKKFVKLLEKQGYTATKDTEKSDHLRATQDQLDAAKVNKFYQRIKNDKDFKGDNKRLIVSQDNYVLDGHHHWAAQIAADAQDNKLGEHKTKVYRINIPIIPLYKLAMKFTGGKGAKGQGDSVDVIDWGGVRYTWHDATGTWQEELHPRGQPGNAGQFGAGGGGSSPKTKAGRVKHERAMAKAAAHLTKAGRSRLQPASAGPQTKPAAVTGHTEQAAASLSVPTTQRQARQAQRSEKQGKKPVEKGDFDKAKIRIGSGSSEAEFVKGWNDRIGIEPEQFKHDFLGGVDATMSINKEGSKFVVNGSINGSGSHEGKSVGTYTRHLDPEHKTAYSAYFQLQKGVQHGDIGKKILAGNVDIYEKLGIESVGVTANIDVGGYAWAKYGYVPTQAAWDELRNDLSRKISGRGSSGGSRSGGSRSGGGGWDNREETRDWDLLSEDTQNEVRDRWKSDTHNEFVDSEIENWRESGQALNEAKSNIASTFSDDADTPGWVNDAIQKARDARTETGGTDYPFTNNQLYLAMKASDYSSRYDDGRDDIEFEFDDGELKQPKGFDPNQKTLPGIEPIQPHELLTDEMRTEITDHVSSAANDRAESDASDIEPPEYITDQVAEYQAEYWSSMDDSQRIRYARDYDLNYFEIPPDEDKDKDKSDTPPEPAPKQAEMKMGQTEDEKLLEILKSSNPKSIWKFADSGERAKRMLLGTNWRGKLNLKDPESYARFKTYVGRAKGESSGKAA